MTTPLARIWTAWRSKRDAAAGDHYVAVAKGDERLPGPVFAAEIEDINSRRQAAGRPKVTAAAPAARHGLVGLGLSGGGIRSAAFNVGVLQTLDRLGLYALVDYLSTVSGGGYLGGAISANHAAAPAADELSVVLEDVPPGVVVEPGERRGDDIHVSGDVASVVILLPHAAVTYTPRLRVEFKDGRPAHGHQAWLEPFRDGDLGAAGQRFYLRLDMFPLADEPGGAESPALRHLRENSDYLMPQAFLARLRLPALFLRGLVVNFLILTPLVLAAALCTWWLAGNITREAAMTTELTVRLAADRTSRWQTAEPQSLNHRILNLRDSVLQYARSEDMPIPDKLAILDPMPGVVVADRPGEKVVVLDIAAADRVPVSLVPSFEGTAVLELRAWANADDAAETTDGADPVTALHTMSVGWMGQAALWLLLALACYPVAQLWAAGGGITSWRVRDWFTRWAAGGALLLIGGAAFISLQPLAIYYFDLLGEVRMPGLGDLAQTMVALGASISALGALSSGVLSTQSGLKRRLGMAAFGAMGPLTVWLAYLMVSRWLIVPETAPAPLLQAASSIYDALQPLAFWQRAGDAPLWQVGGWPDGMAHLAVAYAIWAAVVVLVTHLFYDINATSFHGFYRDRLSRAFLFSLWGRRGVTATDDVKMSALSPRGPYHLINTTLNMATSSDAVLRGRRAAYFIISRRYVGGPVTGYRVTPEMERLHPDLDLATAVAISGAAAAPNMGRATQGGLTFALTLLNVRLGVWLPHPRLMAAAFYRDWALGRALAALARRMLRATPRYLLREMLGQLGDRTRFINLSDGGHLENLGLYELLRRRCRLIIVSDAEADPQMIFQGLADAVRLARIDLGVKIDLNIDAIRPDPVTGLSAAHGAFGRIRYSGGEEGWLIYLKSSLTGDENVYIEKYKAVDATFPHQTTADQFFDEEQFEAYRALGVHVARSVLEPLQLSARPMTAETIAAIAQRSNLVDSTMDEVVRSIP